jgi:site-specific recombinase XerD
MVKIKLAVIRSTRAKDGSYKIRIAIGHKSETHYIVTRFSVPSLSNFKNGTIVGTPTAHHDNLKLRQLLTDYEDRLDRIPNPSELSPTELRDTLRNMTPSNHRTTIVEIFDRETSRMASENRRTHIITFAKKILLEYTNGDMALADINPTTIDGYFRYMKDRKFANSSINTNMQQLKKVINIAIRDGLIRYDIHPFAYWHDLSRPFRDTDISVSDMRKIATLQTTNKHHIIARDALMLSYYLGGINLIDLTKIDFSKTDGKLDYIRTKTRNTSGVRIQFSIHPKAQEIINRLRGSDGHLHFAKLKTYQSINNTIGIYIKELARELKIRNADSLTYYTARKSFVQHGFDLGISVEVLEYCVGHTSGHRRTIYNYMRVMSRHADEAINTIISNLFNDTQ